MNAEKDKRYLVCLRIIEGRVPPVISSRARCGRCGKAVWKADPAPEEAGILCCECMMEMTEESGDDFTIMPPTRKQIANITSVLKRANN
jgi:hypothetical protein